MAGTTCTSTPASTTIGNRPELRTFVDAIPATKLGPGDRGRATAVDADRDALTVDQHPVGVEDDKLDRDRYLLFLPRRSIPRDQWS